MRQMARLGIAKRGQSNQRSGIWHDNESIAQLAYTKKTGQHEAGFWQSNLGSEN